MANGASLGRLIAGSPDIAGEFAHLEGLDVGSRIRSRQASTESALQLARQRRDENVAKARLSQLFADDPELAGLFQAGIDPRQLSGFRSAGQEMGFRETIADPTIDFGARQAAAQAIQGQPLGASEFLGPGGELFTDIFTQPTTAEDFEPTATGAAQIAADEALAVKRLADAEEDLGDKPLSEVIAPPGSGESIIPEDVDPTAAFGAKGVVTKGLNALMDAVNLGTPFPKTAEAQNLLSELSARTQIAMRADVPGGRPPVIVQELLARYAQDPARLFQGDELARLNLRTTRDSLQRSLDTARRVLDAPIERTPTKQQDLVENIINLENTVADYSRILDQLEAKFGPQTGGLLGDVAGTVTGDTISDEETAPTNLNDLQPGQTITLPGGATITLESQ